MRYSSAGVRDAVGTIGWGWLAFRGEGVVDAVGESVEARWGPRIDGFCLGGHERSGNPPVNAEISSWRRGAELVPCFSHLTDVIAASTLGASLRDRSAGWSPRRAARTSGPTRGRGWATTSRRFLPALSAGLRAAISAIAALIGRQLIDLIHLLQGDTHRLLPTAGRGPPCRSTSAMVGGAPQHLMDEDRGAHPVQTLVRRRPSPRRRRARGRRAAAVDRPGRSLATRALSFYHHVLLRCPSGGFRDFHQGKLKMARTIHSRSTPTTPAAKRIRDT